MIWYPESCMGSDIRFPTMWYVRPAKPQISLRKAQSEQSLCKSLEYSMVVKLLSEHHLEFLSLKVGCTGSSESTHVKMPIVGNHMSRLNYGDLYPWCLFITKYIHSYSL